MRRVTGSSAGTRLTAKQPSGWWKNSPGAVTNKPTGPSAKSSADCRKLSLVTIENGQTDIETLRNLLENDVRILTDLIGYLHGGSLHRGQGG